MSREFTSGNRPEQSPNGKNKLLSRGDLNRQRLEASGDWDVIQRRKEKEKFGCVIRSFESALGVVATDTEVDMRLAQVRERKTIDDILSETKDDPPGSADKVARAELAADKTNIQSLLNQITSQDTPLGRALRESTYEQKELSVAEIKQRIRTGEQVCLSGSTPDLSIHMAHLSLDPHDGFISKSDGGVKISLQEDQRFPTYIFTSQEKS